MKKILLSCVTCLLALGLVTACDNEEEGATPNEPETTDPSGNTGDGGGSGGTDNSGTERAEATLLGSFDFSTSTSTGTGISSLSDLDSYWTGEEGLYLGARQYSSVYVGNGSSGAFDGSTTLIKFGTSSLNGHLQLKFAVGTCISEVVVTAHSWNKDTVDEDSGEVTTAAKNQLVINGESQDCSTSGTAEELTYTITDDFTYLLTLESVGRVTVHSIDIYGTYEPELIEPITALKISAEETTIVEGEETTVVATYEPVTAIFDIDSLVWEYDEEVVSVSCNYDDGATIKAVAEGETTVTAKTVEGDVISNSLAITIEAKPHEAPEGSYGIYDFSLLASSYTLTETKEEDTSAHHLTADELTAQLGVAWIGAKGAEGVENENPVTVVTDTSRIDDYNNTTSGWKQGEESLGYLKTGSSSAVGYMSLSLNIDVVKVVVNCHSWTTGTANQKVSVVADGEELVASTSGTATDLTFEISATSSLKIQGNYRVFIASIAIYTE